MSTLFVMAGTALGFSMETVFAQGDACVLTAPLDLPQDEIESLSSLLSAEERARARRCHFQRDRDRYVVGRARLRQLLGIRLGVMPQHVELGSGPHGKPLLVGGHAASGWQFNLARCDDLVLYALSPDRRVGVDVEAMRSMEHADEIVAHFFSPGEREAYRALPARRRVQGFFNAWTRKEAFVKGLGTGMSFAYDRFDVTLVPGEPARLLRVDGIPGAESGWRLDAFSPRPGYVAALASELRRTPLM